MYETEPNLIGAYINDGPGTPELGQNAPGNIGQFTGWQIVKKWMNKNGKKTLDELMKTNAKQIFDEAKSVRYLLTAFDGQNSVNTEGNHVFSNGLINKNFAEIKESDLIGWLESDTTKDDVNALKLNLEKQLKALETAKKVDFPWLANTFTVE